MTENRPIRTSDGKYVGVHVHNSLSLHSQTAGKKRISDGLRLMFDETVSDVLLLISLVLIRGICLNKNIMLIV